MKNNVRAVITLTLITLIAGALLGFVYELTKGPIAIQEEATKQAAYKKVFEKAEAFEPYDGFDAEGSKAVLVQGGFEDEHIEEALIALDASGNKLGYVLTVVTMEGYGGEIDVSMGIDNEGTLNGIEILSISETAGLGMKADTDEFKSKFKDKQVAQFMYTKTGAAKDYEIDALSGATITTNAMVNAVNSGLLYYQSIAGGEAVNE
ncbi:MAG: RnfABCDGE type electron transport complex subunit G [Lachnospiraceae bacterium]|nr:RnfABCDGE type electron transport complex subunit G [Lachnospiraceae bacterium]